MALEDLFREEDVKDIEASFILVEQEMGSARKHRGIVDWTELDDINDE